MASPLTSGFCQRAFTDETVGTEKPTVQILSVKKINANGQSGQDRYRSATLIIYRIAKLMIRIILSDGVHFIQSMLATQLNAYVDDKSLDRNTVIKLTQFVTNAVQGRK
jgi:replication factor A1